MPEKNLNPEDVATPVEPTDELAGLEPSLIEDETPIEPEEPTEEPIEEVIKIGENEIPLNELEKIYSDYSNDNKWKAANDKRSAEIKEKERQLQERETDLRAYEQSQYQKRETPKMEPPSIQGLSQEELEDLDPATKAIYDRMNSMSQQFESWQQRSEQDRFKNELETHHSKLKSMYEDYDPLQIERSYIQGRDQMEDIYLSDKYRTLKSNPDAIKKQIPENLLIEIRKEERAKLITDMKKRQQMRDKVSLPKPDKTTLGKLPEKLITNSHDLMSSAKDFLNENDMSLVT